MDQLTIPECRLLMEAIQLREVDRDYRNHLQAFLNVSVKAQKKVGKDKSRPVYSNFKKFFDYEKAIDKVRKRGKRQDRFAGVKEYLRKGGD